MIDSGPKPKVPDQLAGTADKVIDEYSKRGKHFSVGVNRAFLEPLIQQGTEAFWTYVITKVGAANKQINQATRLGIPASTWSKITNGNHDALTIEYLFGTLVQLDIKWAEVPSLP